MLTRKPRKMNTTPSSSPMKNDQVTPNRFRPLVQPGMKPPSAMSSVAGTREFSVPARKARHAARDGGDEVHDHGDPATDRADHRDLGRDPHDADLRHEDVRGVDRAEDEREGPDDVERRGQDPEVGRHRGPDRDADAVDRVAWRRDRDGQRDERHDHRCRDEDDRRRCGRSIGAGSG